MFSVVVALSVLGLTGVLIARAGRLLDTATGRVAGSPRDATRAPRHALDGQLDDLHAAFERSARAERSDR